MMLGLTLRRAGIGFLIGMAIGNVIVIVLSFLSGSKLIIISDALLHKMGSEAAGLLVQTLLSGLFGAVSMGGMSLFSIDSWGILKSAAVHYLVIMVCYIPIAVFLDWISWSVADVAIMAGILAVMYVIICFIMDAIYKAQVKELNRLQEEANKLAGEEK